MKLRNLIEEADLIKLPGNKKLWSKTIRDTLGPIADIKPLNKLSCPGETTVSGDRLFLEVKCRGFICIYILIHPSNDGWYISKSELVDETLRFVSSARNGESGFGDDL